MDARIQTLAKNLINYSCSLKSGEKVLIWHSGQSTDLLANELIKEAYRAGGIPFVYSETVSLHREFLLSCSVEQMQLLAARDLLLMREMNAYIGIRGWDNIFELSDVPAEKMDIYQKYYFTPVHGRRIDSTKWSVLRYPNYAMAQAAGMSLTAFEDFYFSVCNVNYAKMSQAMDSIIAYMRHTDKVHITGPGTDLTFSIKNIPAVKLDGKINVPDGEIYTAPVRDSVNGVITYNCPSVFQGITFDYVRLEFSQGKIINATANDSARLNKILDTDGGARYIGEFAFGVNPCINKPIKDTLFDEKIAGSLHLTPGRAYKNAYNGNESSIHWDLIAIQTPEYGGGEIFFDDVLIRKDGNFVVPELVCLNPDKLG